MHAARLIRASSSVSRSLPFAARTHLQTVAPVLAPLWSLPPSRSQVSVRRLSSTPRRCDRAPSTDGQDALTPAAAEPELETAPSAASRSAAAPAKANVAASAATTHSTAAPGSAATTTPSSSPAVDLPQALNQIGPVPADEAAQQPRQLPARYFALWPQSSLGPIVMDALAQTLLSADINALPAALRERVQVELSQFEHRFEKESNQLARAVVMHHTDLNKDPSSSAIWQTIWDKFGVMGAQADSPDYRINFDYLVFDDCAMTLTVKDSIPVAEDPLTKADPELWTLPAGSEGRFNLTVLNPPLPSKGRPSPQRLQHAPDLATIFRYHLSVTPTAASASAGAFSVNGFQGIFIRLDNVSTLGKFAVKLMDDTVFNKYSCPNPRSKDWRPSPPRVKASPRFNSLPAYGIGKSRALQREVPSRNALRPDTSPFAPQSKLE